MKQALLRVGPAVVLGLVTVVMLEFTWRTWPDAVVDFGRELYVPWQLAAGRVLYADIAAFNGPFSPYLNAAWFRLSGVSLSSLFVLNFAILVGTLTLLYSLLRRFAERWTTVVALLGFPVLFAFGDFRSIGNYNWMSPYSHEVTHGIALSLLSLWCVDRYAETGRRWFLALSGLAMGIVFLTKIEVFVAGALATLLLVGLTLVSENRQRALASFTLWLAACAVPVLLSVLGLSTAMSPSEALAGSLGSWNHVGSAELMAPGFFAAVAGTDDISGNVFRMFAAALVWVVCLAPAGLLAFAPLRSRWRLIAALAIGASSAALLVFGVARDGWFYDWLRPLPLALLALFGVLGTRWLRCGDDQARRRLALHGAMTCFGGLLLLKVVLNVQVGHYGFGLAMPGTLVIAVLLLDAVVWGGGERNEGGREFAIGALGIWVGLLVAHLGFTSAVVGAKTVQVGRGSDAYFADVRGDFLNATLRRIERRLPEASTLTCFVDCEIVNYLARLPNPARYGNFNPYSIEMFRESTMVESLEQSPPDVVVIVHDNKEIYGAPFFGRHYGRDLYRWVVDHYELAGPPIGAMPMRDRFGVAVYERTGERVPAPDGEARR